MPDIMTMPFGYYVDFFGRPWLHEEDGTRGGVWSNWHGGASSPLGLMLTRLVASDAAEVDRMVEVVGDRRPARTIAALATLQQLADGRPMRVVCTGCPQRSTALADGGTDA